MFGVDNWGIDAIGRLGGAIAANRFTEMEEMRSKVEQRLKERYNRLMEHYERERELGEVLRVGDRVWLERGDLRNKKAKLERKVDGPYTVAGDLGNGAYKLIDDDGVPLKRLVNRRRLRRVR